MTEDARRAEHKAVLSIMIAEVNATLKELAALKSEGKRDVALRRWVMMLGIMQMNVSTAILRLLETANSIAIIILARSVHEYRIKAQYFMKDNHTRRVAFEQYMTIATNYVMSLKKDSSLKPEVVEGLDALYADWLSKGGKTDIYSGKIGVAKMVLAMAKPSEIKIDADGDKYTEQMNAYYNIPSWFVHAAPTMIAEFFPDWADDSNWVYTTEPTAHIEIYTNVRGVIAELQAYMFYARDYYKMPMHRLKMAASRAMALTPVEARIRYEARKAAVEAAYTKPRE